MPPSAATTCRNAVDTNVLFYAHDPLDEAKQASAANLILTPEEGALLWQVACEYLWASRKLEPFGYSRAAAMADIRDLSRIWATIVPDWTTPDHAERLIASYSLSFWDALLIAACLDAGVGTLFSEDFGAYKRIEGLRVVNPFI